MGYHSSKFTKSLKAIPGFERMMKKVEEEGIAHQWHYGGNEGKKILLTAFRVNEGLSLDSFHDILNQDPALLLMRQVVTVWIYILQLAALMYLDSSVPITDKTVAESYHLMRKYRNLLRMFTISGLTNNMETLTIYVPHTFSEKKIAQIHVVDSTEGGEACNKNFKASKTNNAKSGKKKNKYHQKLERNHDRNLTCIHANPNLLHGRLCKERMRKVRKDKRVDKAADYLAALRKRRSANSDVCMCGKCTGGGACAWCEAAIDNVMPMLDSGKLSHGARDAMKAWKAFKLNA